MDNTKDILDYWEFDYEPRDSQVTALNWLAEQDAKYLILEAPVGSGKSNIGITYSKYLGQRTDKGDSFILTPQRILQKQYDDSFSDIESVNLVPLYGKGNYTCADKNASCDIGSIVKPRCESCPHTKAKDAARLASNTVLNYKLALTSFDYTDTFKMRKLMVMDECHTLESHLVDFDAVKIQEWFSKKHKLPFKKQTSLSAAIQWLKDYYIDDLTETLEALRYEIGHLMDKMGSELTRKEIKRIREVESFADHVDEINLLILKTDDYVNEHFVLVNDLISFKFKRLKGSYSFNRILKPKGQRFLFMSSTVLDKNGFCRDLGIPIEETAFLSLDSDFPVENRQVYYMPQMKMNYKWNDVSNAKARKVMANTIETLCQAHHNDSGIIHTANFAIASWVVNQLEGCIPQKIFHHNPDSELDRNDVINEFMEYQSPGVLVSPSSTEGLDLKYDLGKFAIFAKVPYGYLGDQWIKKRMDMSNEWYRRQAMINIIKGGGRIVRAGDDEGSVYILDESFAYLYKQSSRIVPQWWKDAYVVI